MAAKLFVMSQIKLVDPPLQIGFSVSTEKMNDFTSKCRNIYNQLYPTALHIYKPLDENHAIKNHDTGGL